MTNVGSGAYTLGAATPDYTAFTGTIGLATLATTGASTTNFIAVTGGEVNFNGAISGSGNVAVGGTVQTEGNVANGGTAAIAGITMPGYGIVVFGGVNTYNGSTVVNGGELLLATSGGLPGYSNTGALTITGNSILALAASTGASGWSDANIASLLGNTHLTFQPGSALGLDVSSGSIFSSISNFAYPTGGNTNSFVKLDTGTLILNAAQTYTGTTTIAAGTLQIGNGGSLSASSLILDYAALVFNSNSSLTQGTNFSSNITGSGSLTQAGNSTLTLSGTNSFSGGTYLNAGIIATTADSSLGVSGGTLTFGGGLQNSGGIFTTSRPITLATGGGTLDTGTAGSNTSIFSGNVTGANLLTLQGNGNGTYSGVIGGGRRPDHERPGNLGPFRQ